MRRSTIKARAKLAKVLLAFFRKEAPKMAAQINASRARFGKAELSDEERDALDRVVADLDFAGWSVLVGVVEPVLEEITKGGAYAALAQINFDAGEGTLGLVNSDALGYAGERAAELVGMRRDELGRLFPNPSAQWQITESTRDGLRQYVEDAIAGGWSNDKLADAIRDSYSFSAERASVIARTETNKASNEGSLIGYRASGVVDGKQWLTAEDDRVSEECEANGQAGPGADGILMDLEAPYPSGDIAPPAHPNCRCTLAPYIAAEEPQTAEEETA